MTRADSHDDQLVLSIGAVVGHIGFRGAPEPFMAQARARYDAFRLPAEPGVARAFSIELDFEPAKPARPGGRAPEQRSRPLTVAMKAGVIEIDRWDFSIRLVRAPGRGRARWVGQGRCELNPFAVDAVLRVLWSVLLPHEDGALVHACGLRHAEIGVVFPGESGAGKTTLARKAPDADDVLSDEMVVLRRSAGGWRVYGTPFWGDFARGGISMRSWPLRALAFLSQRDGVVMAPVTSSEATLRLLACFVCFQTDRATVERNVALAARIGAEVRSVEAQLTRTATTDEIFLKLLPHLGTDYARKRAPRNPREMISDFRSFLRRHGRYAFRPRGVAGMRPLLKSGDSLLIEAAPAGEPAPGDVLLTWSPGRTPDDDVLTCRRVGPRGEGRAPGRRKQEEILGKVSALSRDGRTSKVSGHVGNLSRLFGSLAAFPAARAARR
jgi:hypothetical protein